ncbi:MAG: hypothetical protein Q8O67_00090 [Deltaproteobacteria bacterium]|nr:hypothetical protein [Deltaproteobacteria bacterium]
MTRATLTVTKNDQQMLRWPPMGPPIDLACNERNLVGRRENALVNVVGGRGQLVEVRLRRGTWMARAHSPGVTVDGVVLPANADTPIQSGQVFVGGGVELRFDVVSGPVLGRTAVFSAGVLDHGGARAPGRWWCVDDDDFGLHLVVTDRAVSDITTGLRAEAQLPTGGLLRPSARVDVDDGLRWRLFRDFPRGVPLRELCSRGAGLEPAVAVDVLARLARWLIAGPPGLSVGVDLVWLGWDGSLTILPPLVPATSTYSGQGLLVELFTSLLPENSAWFTDTSRESQGVQRLWRRLVHPYLGEYPEPRQPQADDVTTPQLTLQACTALGLRTPAITELADVARGHFPEEWRAEQELREELALAKDAGYAAFRKRAAEESHVDDRGLSL